MSLPRKTIDWKHYDQHRADGGSDAAFAKSIGMDPRNFHQYKKSRHKDDNGDLPSIPAHSNALQRISAFPAHSNAPAHSSASQRTEPPIWLNRGMHIATDMADWLDAYARAQRLEKREVLDLALRTLKAMVEGEAVHDARSLP